MIATGAAYGQPTGRQQRGGVLVFWFLLTHVVAFLVDLVTAPRRTDRDKDLQILYGLLTS